MARKTNVTGIKRLSIGCTENDRGYVLHRYLVNIVVDGKQITRSFYFGKNTSQIAAFLNAVRFLKDFGFYNDTMKSAKEIYTQFKHEQLSKKEK